MSKYHFLVVGAGIFGSVFAQQAAEKGKRVLVIDRRPFVAGNLHCELMDGILVHKYGPHIFHTKDREVWNYVNRFTSFNNYLYTPMALCGDELFNLPFNMHTFYQLWGTKAPEEARKHLQDSINREKIDVPVNFEEVCIKTVGRELYDIILKPYIEKQWGMPCSEMPTNALKLRPLDFTFDNRWYDTPYQGIPTEGYDVMIKRMLAGCEVMLNTDFNAFGRANAGIADKIIYTGMIDEYFRFKRGMLDYRTATYKTEVLDIPDYQGTAVLENMNPSDQYARVIEHKHFMFGKQPKTVVTREYPAKWSSGMEPYYPVDDEQNRHLYNAYRALSVTQLDVIFCGRLGSFKYYNMDEAVRASLNLASEVIK